MSAVLKRTPRNQRWVRRLAWLLAFVVVFAAVRWYQQRDMVSGQSPPIDAVLLDGGSIALSELRGRPVLVHFWATWCPICEFEQGAIEALSRDYQVVTVAMRSGDSLAVEAHMREQGLSFPVVVDEDGYLARSYGVRGVPASFVLDAAGRIRFREVGYTTPLGLRMRLWWASL